MQNNSTTTVQQQYTNIATKINNIANLMTITDLTSHDHIKNTEHDNNSITTEQKQLTTTTKTTTTRETTTQQQ